MNSKFLLTLWKDKESETNEYKRGPGQAVLSRPVKIYTSPEHGCCDEQRRPQAQLCMYSRVTKYKFNPLLGNLFTFGPILSSQSYLVLNLLESSFFPSTASDFFSLSLSLSLASIHPFPSCFASRAHAPLCGYKMELMFRDERSEIRKGEKGEREKEIQRSHKNWLLV